MASGQPPSNSIATCTFSCHGRSQERHLPVPFCAPSVPSREKIAPIKHPIHHRCIIDASSMHHLTLFACWPMNDHMLSHSKRRNFRLTPLYMTLLNSYPMKLHRVFLSKNTREDIFTSPIISPPIPRETVTDTLHLSCRSPFKRQGNLLPWDHYSYGRRFQKVPFVRV